MQMTSESRAEARKQILTHIAIIVFATAVAFAPGLNFDFLGNWDDGAYIVGNEIVKSWPLGKALAHYALEPTMGLYTPLTMYSMILDARLFGPDAFFYHLHNLILHILCALLLYFIVRRFAVNGWIAMFAAVLWAISPQKVESVIWITERKDVLSSFFAFAAFYCFLRSFKIKYLTLASGLLSVCAVLAKPSAAALAGVFAMYGLCTARRFDFRSSAGWRRMARIYVFPALLTIAAAGWCAFAMYAGSVPHRLGQWFFMLYSLFWYPFVSLIPFEVNPVHPVAVWSEQRFVMICSPLFFMAFAAWGRFAAGVPWKKILCLALTAGGLVLPTFAMTTQMDHCDRYAYVVSAVMWLAAAVFITGTLRKRPALTKSVKIGLTLYSVVFFILTWSYIPYWENCESLYAYSLEKNETVNIKVFANGAYAAKQQNNAGLLDKIGKRMIADHLKYAAKEKIMHTGLVFTGRAAVIEKDYGRAKKIYAELEKRLSKPGASLYPTQYKDLVVPTAIKDLATLAILDGNRKEALARLNRFIMAKSEFDDEYYQGLSMKALLENDYETNLKACAKLLEANPSNLEYRRRLDAAELLLKKAKAEKKAVKTK